MELDGFILRLNGKGIRIFKLRSIRGRIGIDFNRKGDVKFLIHGDNLELLNIISIGLKLIVMISSMLRFIPRKNSWEWEISSYGAYNICCMLLWKR